jgi:hypothetical protein
MVSPHYRLIGSMGPGAADGTVSASPMFELHSGLIGGTQ